jgi:SH3 domain-containing YSC84-like protein 1
MRMTFMPMAACLSLCLWAGAEEDKRLAEATKTLDEVMSAADRSIPGDLFGKANCAIIIPGMKMGGFIFGGKYGRGFASCRGSEGGWTAPSAMRLENMTFGLQIGGSEVDIVMLVMSKKGMDRLLSTKFTLGADATGAAGPVGRSTTAQTDAALTADILSWSRSRGVFGGITLTGGTMRPDGEANKGLYAGKDMDNREILSGKVTPPAAAASFLAALAKHGGATSPK